MSGSHSSGPVSTNDSTVMPSGGIPALFTRMSTGPVSRTIAGTPSRSVTSATTGRATRPSSPISAATFSARSECKSLTHTSAPALAIWMAMARPTPAPDPVTRATRPAMKFDQSRIMRRSDFHDHRDDRGAATGPLVDELAERAPSVTPQRVEVGRAFVGRLGQRRQHRHLRFADQLLGFGRVDPSPGDDLGAGDDLTRSRIDGDDHHDDTLLGQAATVAQHAVAHVADDAVDVEVPGGHRPLLELDAGAIDGEGVAVLAHDDLLGRDADLLGQLGVMDHVPVLAVDGDEELRLQEVEDELQLLLRGVPGDVHGGVAAVDN